MRAAGLWDLREGRDSRRFPLAGDSLMGADLRADGRFVATVTLNGPLKLWEVGTGLELASAESSDGHLNAVRFHPSQGLLAVAGAAVSLWRMA